jgi:hypothetical protein
VTPSLAPNLKHTARAVVRIAHKLIAIIALNRESCGRSG